MTTIATIGHIALTTPDLDRFRRFYEGVLGLPMTVVMRIPVPPGHRHAAFQVATGTVLHVFEVPGYDPADQGIGSGFGERGRIDHFGFLVDGPEALEAIAARLRACGASDGEVRPLGPFLSVMLTDPDGLQLEVNCVAPGYHPDADPTEEIEEQLVPEWWTLLAPAAPGPAR